MDFKLSRRAMIAAIAGVFASRTASAADESIAEELASIQAASGGRIGLHAFDLKSGRSIGMNDHDRFAMCSTFKLLLAAAILDRVDAGKIDPQQRVKFSSADMLSHAPRTSSKLDQGFMTVVDLCAAAVEMSDNPAANLLLSLIDGPAGLTRYLRRIGDEVTRLDRFELELNSNLPGDPRDTTTPHAMSHTAAKIVLGDVLAPASRQLLRDWMIASPTGERRIRAGLPKGWKAGDKTGTGTNGAVNDVAILWPPGGSPVAVAVYMSDSKRPARELEPFHAQIAAQIAESMTG